MKILNSSLAALQVASTFISKELECRNASYLADENEYIKEAEDALRVVDNAVQRIEGTRPKIFEYDARRLPMGSIVADYVSEQLNALGQDGWELCGFEYGHAFFKREVVQ